MTQPTTPESASTSRDLGHCTLHVCTSCRPGGTPREPREGRPGFRLHRALQDALEESPLRDRLDIKPAECLSLCKRPCGIALSTPGAWTYLFGDQDPATSASDVLACIERYLSTSDGHLPRLQRPESMQASILGRVPPLA